MITQNDFCAWGLDVIAKESQAIAELSPRIDATFSTACELLLQCQGRIVVVGLGKSGHVGSKIAATLASTGSPAFFVHAGEASHGDFGMITRSDVVIAISNSGKTSEILSLLPFLKRLEIPLISFTGCPDSPLAIAANVNINVAVTEEACPLDLAPTCSTTAALVMGDAIAVALLRARGFSKEDFALSHPGGTLGKRLLLRVGELMRKGDDIPKVSLDTPLKYVLMEMTAKRLGMTTVVDQEQRLRGIFTDGDLRRAIENKSNLMDIAIEQLMTPCAKTTRTDVLAYEVFSEMETYKITAMPVVDEQQRIVGVLHLHDILQAGVI